MVKREGTVVLEVRMALGGGKRASKFLNIVSRCAFLGCKQ